MFARLLEFVRRLHRYLEIDIMAILDAITAAVGNAETVGAAAAARLKLVSQESDEAIKQRDEAIAERDALKTQVIDLAAEAANAQALADRLTAANTALQAAVEAA